MKGLLYIITFLFVSLLLPGTGSLAAQDSNIKHSIAKIEKMLNHDSFELKIPKDIRYKGDAAKRATLTYADRSFLQVKMKRSAQGGANFNNQPRYEIAAYHLQKLFLDSADYVVPPTAARAIPMSVYENIEANLRPTFANTEAVLCVFQYWLSEVGTKNIYDARRFAKDPLYAYHFGNFNIFTYLIRHSDSNVGNYLISKDPQNPRVFSVDNGIAFGNIMSERGYEWREMVLKRLPAESIRRLRKITPEMLRRQLETVAQFRLYDNTLLPSDVSANLNPDDGVRYQEGILQLGLTAKEIAGVYQRLEKLLERIDSGAIAIFEHPGKDQAATDNQD